MKTLVLPTVLALVAGVCAAQEMGRVLSATPVVQQVGVPRQVYVAQPPRYATRPYYPPMGVNLDFAYYGGHRGHWR